MRDLRAPSSTDRPSNSAFGFRGLGAVLLFALGLLVIWRATRSDVGRDDGLGLDSMPSDSVEDDAPDATTADRSRAALTARTVAESGLVVRVVDADGVGVADVAVVAMPLMPPRSKRPSRAITPAPEPSRGAATRTQVTDRSGEARFALASGHWLLRANPGRSARPNLSEPTHVVELTGTQRDLVLTLDPATASLALRVREAGNAPLSGVPIVLRRVDPSAATSVDEVPSFPLTSPFKWGARSACNRRSAASYEVASVESCLSCHAPEASRHDEGLVVSHLAPDGVAWTTSDASGELRFRGLRAGTYRVEALQPSQDAAVRIEDPLWLPRAHAMEIALRPGESRSEVFALLRTARWILAVQPAVTTPNFHCSPVAASTGQVARIAAWAGIEPERMRRMLESRTSYIDVTSWIRATSRSEDGVEQTDGETQSFHVDLPPGPWRFHFEIEPGSTFLTPRLPQLDLGPRLPQRLSLRIEKSPHEASGRFVDADGIGIPGLSVVARDPEGNLLKRTSTGADGSYRIRGLPARPLVLCWHDDRSVRSDPPLHRDLRVLDGIRCARFAGPMRNQVHRLR